jgi:hypothetical protein
MSQNRALMSRPPIGDRPMTAAERKRRQRERDRTAAAYLARPAPGSTSRRCRDAHEQTNGFIREAVSFLVDYGNRLPVWLKGAKLSREDKDALVRTLHQVANELTLLAQKVDGVAAVGTHRMRGSMVRRR